MCPNTPKNKATNPTYSTPPTLVLRTLPLFAGLSDEHLGEIGKVSRYREVLKNTVVMKAGDFTDALYVLVSGSAKVVHRDAEGREVIITLLRDGDCFGEMGSIADAPRSADVVANENSMLLAISKQDFMKALEGHSDLCLNIMRSLIARLRDSNRKVEQLALMDVTQRVALLLLDLADQVDGEYRIRHHVSKQDIAKMVGASREAVSRVLRELRACGYLNADNHDLVLHPDQSPPPQKKLCCRC